MSELRGLDTERLQGWLEKNLPDRIEQELRATMLVGGLSNLTYRLDAGTEPFVLRRPPLGHVQSTAHDMSREFRIISALAPTDVAVPPALLLEPDAEADAGIGAPFYLMDFVTGEILSTRAKNQPFSTAQLHRLSLDLIDTLAALHRLDPATVGLADFGHEEGYMERQLRRWGTQYEGSQSRDLPSLDRLQDALRDRMPATLHSSLLHGDYRLDNAIVATDAAGDPHIAAVLDWEMATIGDSFADLGLLGLYWNVNELDALRDAVPSAVDTGAGYPTLDELVDHYAHARRIAVPDLGWYVAFSAYKLAVILEGIHFRYQAGETVGAGFDRVGQLVEPLALVGLGSLSRRR